MVNKNTYTYALGRRKRATARVRIQPGKGVFTINGIPSVDYFSHSKLLLTNLEKPFTLLELNNKFDVSIVVSGGGHMGQVDAIKLGVSKALAIMNQDLKATLKKADLLGRDPRKRERKKFGLKGARKQRQFTKR